jgi:hypothetical protein
MSSANRIRPRPLARLVLLATALACAAGCGGSGLRKVEGEVLLDDQPVAGALVVFQREDSGGPPANAVTDEAGHFRLSTFASGDGVLPGTYKVTVSKYADPPGPAITLQPSDPGYLEQYEKAQRARLKAPPRPLLPVVYENMTTTPLRQRVPPEGKVVFRLEGKGR